MKISGSLTSFTRERLDKICNHALMAGVEAESVVEMIRRRCLKPPVNDTVSERWPWDVRISTLGGFAIASQQNRLVLSAKTPRKLLELLTLLICGAGDGISREKICEVLWPDSDADLALQALNTAVHRLRKLLRQNEVVVTDGYRLLLNPKLCYVDCHHFLMLSRQINLQAVSSEERNRVIACLRLYGGAFVTGHESLSLALDFARVVQRNWHRVLGAAVLLALTCPLDQLVEKRLELALADDECATEALKAVFINSLRHQSREGAVATVAHCYRFFTERDIAFGPHGRALLSDLCLI